MLRMKAPGFGDRIMSHDYQKCKIQLLPTSFTISHFSIKISTNDRQESFIVSIEIQQVKWLELVIFTDLIGQCSVVVPSSCLPQLYYQYSQVFLITCNDSLVQCASFSFHLAQQKSILLTSFLSVKTKQYNPQNQPSSLYLSTSSSVNPQITTGKYNFKGKKILSFPFR